MFIKRAVYSILILTFVGLTIFVLPNWFFGLIAVSIIAAGLYEFFSLVEKKQIPIYKYFGIFLGILIPISAYLEVDLTKGWELFFMVAVCFMVFIMQLARKEKDHAITGVSTTLFGIFYISWFFSFIIKLKFLPAGTGLVGFLVLVTKAGDIGAYIAGSTFGKHALIKRISPKKTWEGAIGGFICSVAVALAAKGLIPHVSILQIILLGGLLGISAQVGDLYESLIKRDCQVKDTGKTFSALGGTLDIIDSILFTAPIFYFYARFML